VIRAIRKNREGNYHESSSKEARRQNRSKEGRTGQEARCEGEEEVRPRLLFVAWQSFFRPFALQEPDKLSGRGLERADFFTECRSDFLIALIPPLVVGFSQACSWHSPPLDGEAGAKRRVG
jgi:hypothetical protein